MAFEVTATKKRPQIFDEIAGQEFVVSTMKNALTKKRIAHAYLFSGPRGVGKTSAARILAKSLNCEQGPTMTPCGICPSCISITQGNSLDVIEIDGASNTSVNDVRTIKDEVLFAPNSSRYKIYIIDEVHMLSNSAFNALLKTIEEPPPYVVFVFATTEGHKVPATIRSRCQQFHFQLISLEVIKTLLGKASLEMGLKIDDDALFWIAKEATGSLRDAYTLFDQVVSFSQGTVTLEKIRETMGLVGIERINQLVEALLEQNIASALEQTQQVLKQGVSVEQFTIDLTEYFRSLLFLLHGINDEEILGVPIDRFSRSARKGYTPEQLEAAIDMLLTLYRSLRYSLNQKFELELFISRLATLPKLVSPTTLVGRIEALKNSLYSAELPDPDTAAAPDSSRDSAEPVSREKSSAASKAPSQYTKLEHSETRGMQRNSTSPSPAASGVSAQTNNRPVTDHVQASQQTSSSPSGFNFSEKHRDELQSKLKDTYPALASNIGNIVDWNIEGNKLTLIFGNNYAAKTAAANKQILVKAFAVLFKFHGDIELSSSQEYNPTAKQEPSQQKKAPVNTHAAIKLVQNAFRGEILEKETGDKHESNGFT